MRLRVLLAIAGMATLVAAAPAGAATFTVTTTSDGAGSCTGTSCTTLRAAVTQANSATDADTIQLDAATYFVASVLTVSTPVTIVGKNAANTTVTADGKSSRVLDVGTGGVLGIQHATIANGFAENVGDVGGDMRVFPGTSLRLDHVRVTNGASGQGGGIAIGGGATVQIAHSLLDGNHATISGGAIAALGNAKLTAGITLTISDSTIASNTASTRAGILGQNDTRNRTSLLRSTVASNAAGSNDGGAGIDLNDAESFTVTASIISGNTGDGVADNCLTGVVLTSGGANVDSGARCGLATKTDLQNTDPQLGSLTAGLGETPVMPISGLSPAVDLVPVGDKSCTGTDQRDLRRPQGVSCDAGAYEVDQAPDTTIASGPSGLTNSSSASFGFTSGEPGVTFQCELDGPGTTTGTFAACASPKAYSGLADGSYTFQVRAVDGTGNTDATPATRSFTVDTTPPTVTITGGPSGPTNVTSPSFSFTIGQRGATVECKLDGPGATTGTFAACTSPQAYGPLADGAYAFTVRATDAAGNVGTASRSFTVDTVAPDTTITGGPAGPTNNASPSFTFSSPDAGATFQCKLDGPGATTGTFAACTSPKAYSALADGAYTFSVRASDTAGNVGSAATRAFTVDTVAPDTTITSGPSGPTKNASPSFTFSSPDAGATFQCKLDGPGSTTGTFAACTSPKGYGGLADGSYTFSVRAVDPAGNIDATPATRTFTVDTAPPEVTITSGPSGPTNNASPSFGFVVDAGATTDCRLDGPGAATGTFTACTSAQAYSGLGDGEYTFRVRASDAAGNSSTASRTFTLDTGAPTSSITSGPSGTTNDRSPSFGFTANDAAATFECRLDTPSGPGAFSACAAPKGFGPLADGAYTFHVRATDATANTGPEATRSFTVDTAPPPADVTSGPSGTTADTAASFGFGSPDPGATFECRLDGPGAAVGAYGPCASPQSFSRLAPGAYTFRLLARDSAGNTTETARSFTVLVPKPNQTVVVDPVSGQTLIKKPGSKRFVPLDVTQGIPLGSIVDTRHSRIRLEAIRRAGQPLETALFYGGIFKVTQTAAVTQLRLVERLSCPAPGHASTARKRRSRRLWGDGHGQFRTRGQFSSATVRGTKWLVQDSCGATLTRVARGVVTVRDLVKKKTVRVPAGHRYIARRR